VTGQIRISKSLGSVSITASCSEAIGHKNHGLM
jgi:hypothetical protein